MLRLHHRDFLWYLDDHSSLTTTSFSTDRIVSSVEVTDTLLASLMFSRLGQVARHLSRPVSALSSTSSSIMSNAQQKSLIHTAACLIIGDEVLGGKVCSLFILMTSQFYVYTN